MRARLALLALGAAIPLLAAEGATACSCVPPRPAAQLKASDGAFVGRLVAIREVDPPAEGEPVGSGDPVDYVYRVGRVYKRGPGLRRGRRVRVRSARYSASCGLPRARGRLYGLFVFREDRRWHGNLCNVVTPAQLRRGAEASGRATDATGPCGSNVLQAMVRPPLTESVWPVM
jgi:hypothetical protein